MCGDEQTCADAEVDSAGTATLSDLVLELTRGLESARGNTGGRRGVRVGLELSSSRWPNTTQTTH